MRSRSNCRSLDTAGLPPDALEPGDEADAQRHEVHHRQPGHERLLVARVKVETGVHTQARDSVGAGCHRHPDETEPKGREHHGKDGEGRIVSQEDEARVSAVDDDAGGYHDNLRGAEEEHPAPRHRPVRQEPMVNQAVEYAQQHRQAQEFDVLGIPEARPVNQQEDADQPDEPATPDRDRCRIQKYVRVGQGAWRHPLL